MNIKKSEYRVCPCCMEEHEVYTVNVREWNVFKEKEVEYEAVYTSTTCKLFSYDVYLISKFNT